MKKFMTLITTIMFLTLLASQTAIASDSKMSGHKNFLENYPALGSEESNADFKTLHYFQATRTEADCAAAGAEVKANLKNFYGSMLSASELKEIQAFFLALKIDVGLKAVITKYKFKRPRPYLIDPTLKPCIKLEKTYAYPSGHATMARLYARVLAHMYPERAEAFLEHGEEIALHRVLGGVHHPSDIVAGRKLGDLLANDVLE
ncbi:MAG: phosphatase PAP2 family protein [Bacteriovoracaceae bacterium]